MPGYVTAPSPSSGGFAPFLGALVLIETHSFEAQAITPFGIKDQCQITLTVVDHPTDPTMRGHIVGMPVSNVLLVGQLRSLVGQTALGRIVHGRGSQGNPPIKLDPPTPADEALADQFNAEQAARPAQQAYQQPQQPAQPSQAGYAAPPPGYPSQVPVGAQGGAQQAYSQPAGLPAQPPF